MRANLGTLYLLVNRYETLPNIRNLGAKCLAEINDLLSEISINGLPENIVGDTNVEETIRVSCLRMD